MLTAFAKLILLDSLSIGIFKFWKDSIISFVRRDLADDIPDLYDLYIKKLENILIKVALDHCNGKKINAAKKLGVGRNTITRKIKDLNIDWFPDKYF